VKSLLKTNESKIQLLAKELVANETMNGIFETFLFLNNFLVDQVKKLLNIP